MLTNFSKALAVLTAVISVAALGAVLVTGAGGPNWQAEAAALRDYEFTSADGPPITWTSKTRTPRSQAGAAPAVQTAAQNTTTLAEAVLKSREALQKEQQEQIAQLDREIPPLQARIAEAKDLNQKDIEAMKKREQALVAERSALAADIERLTKESTAKADQIKALGAELEKRRSDVFRLQNELGALRADRFRLDEQQKRLAALLVRIKGSNASLERREAQLLAMGAVDSKPADSKHEPPEPNAPPAKAAAAVEPKNGNDPVKAAVPKPAAKPDDADDLDAPAIAEIPEDAE